MIDDSGIRLTDVELDRYLADEACEDEARRVEAWLSTQPDMDVVVVQLREGQQMAGKYTRNDWARVAPRVTAAPASAACDHAAPPAALPGKYKWLAVTTSSIACVAAIAVIAWSIWPSGNVSAGTSTGELRFLPATPRAGDTVVVRYRPSADLTGYPTVVLRAQYYENDHFIPAVVSADTLQRGRDGMFRGVIRVPSGASYSEFAVENLQGTVVDANDMRLWQLPTHDALGHPTPGAFVIWSRRELDRNSDSALALARAAVITYPDQPWLEGLLRFYEKTVRGVAYADSAAAARALASHAAVGVQSVPTLRLGDYVRAREAGDSAVLHTFERRDGPWRNEQYLIQTLSGIGRPGSPREHLAPALEEQFQDSVWRMLRSRFPVSHMGYNATNVSTAGAAAAWQLGDAAKVEKWFTRIRESHWIPEQFLIEWLKGDTTRRTSLLPVVRSELRRLDGPDDEMRPLGRTRQDQARADAALRRALLVHAGKLLIAAGDRAAGLDSLDAATRIGWDVETFKQVARARLALGDTSPVASLYALIANDPSTSVAQADSLRLRLGSSMTPALWKERLAAGQREMRDRVLGRAVYVPIRGDPSMLDATGARVHLGASRAGRVTLLVVTSQTCGWCVEELPRLQLLADTLEARGASVIVVMADPDRKSLGALLESRRFTHAILSDDRREISRALNVNAYPSHFVLDRSGVVRFETRDLEAIPVQVRALQER